MSHRFAVRSSLGAARQGVPGFTALAGRGCAAHRALSHGPLEGVGGASSGGMDQCVLSRGRSRSAGVGVLASQGTVQRVHSRDPRPAGVGAPATRGADPRVHSRGPSVSGSSLAAVDGSGTRVFFCGRPGSPAGQVPGFPSRSGDVPPWKRARHFPSLREGETLRRRSLMVSKALTNFARYPERRLVGITPLISGPNSEFRNCPTSCLFLLLPTIFYSVCNTLLLPTAQGITLSTESFFSSHDPITHVRKARNLTVVGDAFLNVSLSLSF